MPEGDAVRRLAVTFEEHFVGRRCRVTSPQGRFTSSAAVIDGWMMTSATSVGKHLFLEFAPAGGPVTEPLWIHVHLGLYGSWRFQGDATFTAPSSIGAPRTGPSDRSGGRDHPGLTITATVAGDGAGTDGDGWEAPDPIGQVRVRIATTHGVADLSGPTRCDLITDPERRAALARLGPDPLAPGAREDAAARRRFVLSVRAHRRAVGELVMDQSVIAGVGNIYRAEGLFLEGISPFRPGSRVSEARLGHLWIRFCDLMSHGVAVGRIETVDAADAPEPPLPGDPEASRWYVYHRAGRPCLRCGGVVQEQVMQGRKLFWCPRCQH